VNVLIATATGLVDLDGAGERSRPLAGHSVRAPARGPGGRWLAIVDRREVWQRDEGGEWRALAAAGSDLSCLASDGATLYAGGTGPAMFRLGSEGTLEPLDAFGATRGHEEWHGVGYPLEVRSLTVTADGALLANVHVGGIPRSADGGATWEPTIPVGNDVHEVRAHRSDAQRVVAAAAVGLCQSRDGGRTWDVVATSGMHSTYARAVTYVGGDDVLVTISDGPFAERSAIYRHSRSGATTRVRGGLPEWLEGNVDTRCIDSDGTAVALADGGGNVWISPDGWTSWSRAAAALPHVTAVVVT
jgi:hypothetical protein